MAKPISDRQVRMGIRRLLESPLTLKSCGAPVWEPKPNALGSASHKQLFVQYLEEVDFVTAVALDWWKQTLAARKKIASDPKRAAHDAWIDRPAGPASYPGLVALTRDYWLACHQLNLEVPEELRVPPWTFLLSWLLNGSYGQAVSVLACMPYWPIGLDEDGNWV
jgi:hypothetical protein